MTPGIEKFSSGNISISDPPKTKLDPRTVFHYLKTSEKGIGAVEMSFGGKLVPIGYFRRTTDGGLRLGISLNARIDSRPEGSARSVSFWEMPGSRVKSAKR